MKKLFGLIVFCVLVFIGVTGPGVTSVEAKDFNDDEVIVQNVSRYVTVFRSFNTLIGETPPEKIKYSDSLGYSGILGWVSHTNYFPIITVEYGGTVYCSGNCPARSSIESQNK